MRHKCEWDYVHSRCTVNVVASQTEHGSHAWHDINRHVHSTDRMAEPSQDLKLYRDHFHHQPVSLMNHSRISSVTQYVFSISLWTQITLPMRHTWVPADSSFNSKSIPCSGRASFTKASKGNCLCESFHAGVVLFQAMRNYKKSQAINISVQPYRGIKKIYSHAGQYAKITYKMSLSLSKILSIQEFSWKSASEYIFFLK